MPPSAWGLRVLRGLLDVHPALEPAELPVLLQVLPEEVIEVIITITVTITIIAIIVLIYIILPLLLLLLLLLIIIIIIITFEGFHIRGIRSGKLDGRDGPRKWSQGCKMLQWIQYFFMERPMRIGHLQVVRKSDLENERGSQCARITVHDV